MNYYIPALFKRSPTFQVSIPCLIRDIALHFNRSRDVVRRYYAGGITVWFFNNYPISCIEVLGCVVGWKWKMIGESDYAIFNIDDCTRDGPETPTLLQCKCSRSLVLRSGLPIGALIGWRLKLTGTMNDFAELEVSSVVICTDLTQEIEYWQSALRWRKRLDAAWVVEDDIAGQVLTQEGWLKSTSLNFIQRLEFQHYQNEMQITESSNDFAPREIVLPFKHGSLDVLLDAESAKIEPSEVRPHEAGLLHKVLDMEGPKKEARDIQHVKPKPTNRVTTELNSNQLHPNFARKTRRYEQQLLAYLLTQNHVEISTLNTFKSPALEKPLKTAARAYIGIETGPNGPTLDEQSSRVFAEALEKLATMGLLHLFAQGRIINLQSLQRCYEFVKQRVEALVKLRSLTGKIDYSRICRATGLNPPDAQINTVFLHLHKRALRALVEDPSSGLRSWWVEPAAQTADSAYLRLEYTPSTCSLTSSTFRG